MAYSYTILLPVYRLEHSVATTATVAAWSQLPESSRWSCSTRASPWTQGSSRGWRRAATAGRNAESATSCALPKARATAARATRASLALITTAPCSASASPAATGTSSSACSHRHLCVSYRSRTPRLPARGSSRCEPAAGRRCARRLETRRSSRGLASSTSRRWRAYRGRRPWWRRAASFTWPSCSVGRRRASLIVAPSAPSAAGEAASRARRPSLFGERGRGARVIRRVNQVW